MKRPEYGPLITSLGGGDSSTARTCGAIDSTTIATRGVPMDIRFHLDLDTGLPHIYGHGVTEAEAEYILRHPGQDRPGRDRSRHSMGQTSAGRYLRVIYVPDGN